jgi:membrane protein DedA with SNARE-associated domain
MRPSAEFWWREDLLDWTVLYWMLLPLILLAAGINAAWNWWRTRRRKRTRRHRDG